MVGHVLVFSIPHHPHYRILAVQHITIMRRWRRLLNSAFSLSLFMYSLFRLAHFPIWSMSAGKGSRRNLPFHCDLFILWETVLESLSLPVASIEQRCLAVISSVVYARVSAHG